MRLWLVLALLLGLMPTGAWARAANRAPRNWQWKYRRARRVIEKHRKVLARELQAARTAADRQKVLKRAWQTIIRDIDRRLFPYWYGTPWNIRGATIQPRVGSIACGTFVSTVLEHAGFRVERSLGGLNSPGLMKTLTTKKYLKLTYRWSIRRFVRLLRRMGGGLYIVGLDMHVGFLLVRGRRVYFVHSNYTEPAHVLKERASKSEVLTASRYRLVGRISHDPKLIEKWLLGTKLPTWRRKRRRRAKR